jgi:hypothetical protein
VSSFQVSEGEYEIPPGRNDFPLHIVVQCIVFVLVGIPRCVTLCNVLCYVCKGGGGRYIAV